jgi:hypothetical protein
MIPIAFIDDKPVAWLYTLKSGEIVVITEKIKRVHEGRPECLNPS